MGATHSSIPPPLVEVSAPGGRVLVPPYTHFSVHPPRHGDLVYRPVRQPQRPRRPRPDVVIGVDEELASENEFGGMEGMGMSPRMGGRGFGGRGGFGPIGGGGGGIVGRGRGDLMFEMDGRPRSAPEMGMGGFPGMGMGMRSPRMGMGHDMRDMGSMRPYRTGPGGIGSMGLPGGAEGPGIGGMGPFGGMGGPDMEGMGPPPGYSSMQPMPQYNEVPRGGMPGGNTFPNVDGPPREPSSTGVPSEKPMRRPSRRAPGRNTHVPMGAFAKTEKSPQLARSSTEPTTEERLNGRQPKGRRVGPSGKEWLEGDDFLDACVCTTRCTCRQGHRVLYRSRDGPVGSDSEHEAGPRYSSGEIRYILKSKLGQDCGDHSGCKKGASSSESEAEIKRRKKKEEKKQKKQLEGLKVDMLEAIDEKLEALKKARSSKAPSASSPRPPFIGPGATPNAFGLGDVNAIDPLMAQKLGMGGMGMPIGVNPYAMRMQSMGKLPPGMIDPISSRPMRSGQMPMGDMGFEDDMSIGDMEGVPMGNPYLTGRMKGKGMPIRFMSPGRRKPGVFGEMEMDPMAFYSKASGGRRGIIGARGPRDPRRRRFGSDDFELGGRRPGLKNRENSRGGIGDMAGELALFASAVYRGTDDGTADILGAGYGDDPMATTHRGSPNGARNPGRNADRGRHARAETDDDDEF